MTAQRWANYAKNYFNRFASPESILEEAPAPACQMIVVIPCHNEPDLTGTLDALLACQLPSSAVEVITVVNQGENASEALARQNQQTIADFRKWHSNYKAQDNSDNLKFHLIEALGLPKKHAGVGLARKTGMDEALRRFISLDFDGAIVCLDADCRVSENYLTAIESEFLLSNATVGELFFEHPWENEENPSLQSGIVHYELFLRYYVEGLRQAGFPHAIHTIGSCMLVKASAYARHGGMNKRKAGEDFYFLHKLVPHEPFVTVHGARVFPSCRTSDRVPFGTGKAQQDWLDKKEVHYPTYDPIVFAELRSLINSVPSFYRADLSPAIGGLNPCSREFIGQHDYEEKIALIKSNCKTEEQFMKQFFQWFSGFLCLKFVHYLRDHFYPNTGIEQAASQLINSQESTSPKLLKEYRLLDLQQAL